MSARRRNMPVRRGPTRRNLPVLEGPSRRGVRYTNEQWEGMRPIFTQLYAREDRWLWEVRSHLYWQYGFDATERMYQRKIENWGLPKKHKAHEMLAVIYLMKQYQARGQAATIRIRGRDVDMKRVREYFKRKKMKIDEIDVSNVRVPDTVTHSATAENDQSQHGLDDVVIHVGPGNYLYSNGYPTADTTYHPMSCPQFPSASPGSGSDSSIRSNSFVSTPWDFRQGTLDVRAVPDFINMPLPMDLTFEDRCSRLVLGLTETFFGAVVPSDFWSQDLSHDGSHLPWRRTMSAWSRATSEGRELLRRGQVKESFALRNRAMESVPKHITNTSPIILFRYFEIIHGLCVSGENAFLSTTMRYVLARSDGLLPRGHPIPQLAELFLHPQVSARAIIGPLAHQGLSKCLRTLYERCPDTHPRILYVLDSQTQTFLDEQQYEKAIVEAHRYQERARQILGDQTFEACQARRMLADAYAAVNRLDEAEIHYNDVLRLKNELEAPEDRGLIEVKALRGLAYLATGRERPQTAKRHLRTALQTATTAFGPGDAQVMLIEKDLAGLQLNDPDPVQ